ncbi:MAG TPA: hypothetical protein VKA46_09185 [Gemmataceae bacterium]|nr:hypothetical protein [Gemmataceae bacterium]
MQAAEFTANIPAMRILEIPAAVWQELQLRPGLEVKIVLLRKEDTPEDLERLARMREEAWRQMDEIREHLSGMNFNATEAVLRARHGEE